jgi:SAM-dependent MidA family methyltransferase
MASEPPADPGAFARLLAAVEAVAEPDGFIPWDRYMDTALYADGVGFYARPYSPLGADGDFYTAAHVHPLFAATIGEWVAEVHRTSPRDRPFHLVELGPGDGRLAAGVVAALRQHPEGTAGMTVVLIERSAPLLARAVERVRSEAEASGIPVLTRDSVASLGPFEGVVLANELLDAQPVRRLLRRRNGWVELGVRIHAGGLVPAEGPGARPVPGSPLPAGVAEGTVFEVSPRAEAVVREVADHLVRGRLLVDDYGMEESELLAAHPDGTLAGVRAHRSGWDPLEAAGETDLSAFVNFSRLRAAAHAAGLRLVSDRRQAEALGEWGFPRLLDAAVRTASSPEAEVRLRLAAKSLSFGFERFRILEWEPTSPAPGSDAT